MDLKSIVTSNLQARQYYDDVCLNSQSG